MDVSGRLQSELRQTSDISYPKHLVIGDPCLATGDWCLAPGVWRLGLGSGVWRLASSV